jgi:hypothetical protein
MPVSPYIPWRSVWLPRAITAIALLVGLPLFLRSPPWCDITLYQMAARNILHGGVHYRDLFDTNLPGFVWAMTALYSVFGPNVIVVRLLDLLIVLGVVLLIDRLAKWGGATPAARWWAFASVALFYPFTAEMSHAQRDTWMALPGLAAVALRVRRGMVGGADTSHFLKSLYEGVLWGAAVWMKPHIMLMALAVWLLTAWRLAAEHPRPWRAVVADLFGNLLGGIVVGIPGVCWLVGSDAWSDFREVFLEWNPHYMKLAQAEFDIRMKDELYWFPSWSLGLILTVPLALFSVLDMAPWAKRAGARADGWLGRWLPWQLWDKQAGTDARFARGVLGGLYLVWAAQAFFVQRGFHYVHVPETLLMFGVWASHRWAWAFVALAWLAITSGLWLAADCDTGLKTQLGGISTKTQERYLPRHLLTNTTRLRLWPECWRLCMSDAERYALWDKLNLQPPHEAVISWQEIAELAEYFRAQGVKDGQVIAWFNSPHAVFLLLDMKPGFRYMHVYTAISISGDESGKIGRPRVMAELKDAKDTKGAKYVISDLEWVALIAVNENTRREDILGPPRNPPHDLLPVCTPLPGEFPFNQPTVFRTRNGNGRYVVHLIKTCEDTK